ncbi:phospholipase [Bacterioplanes sanyensis]|uniref:Phospholipase n=1 Tax=Bacterioplanes sanyensis TaxID=1249553 RepID=A0A222FJC6_9GAMM|nr:phospholipase [Bacterioplanes sanyensis]
MFLTAIVGWPIKFARTLLFFLSAVLAVQAHSYYINTVERQLRQQYPGSEGSVWQVTDGNRIAGIHSAEDSWLLQTPNCWGDPQCNDSGALQHYADTIEADIASARHWVDITTLVTYPDGIFQQAIVSGLRQAYAQSPTIRVRILGGTPPVMGNIDTSYTETAKAYMRRLKQDLGAMADNLNLSVAGVETSWLYSWNHSKIIAVDGRSSIVGGHNMWESAYGQVDSPINDLTMRLKGPAAVSAHQFADLLWQFTCRWKDGVVNKTLYVDLEQTNAAQGVCPTTFTAPEVAVSGNVRVLSLGGLGFGMQTPGGDEGGLPAADDSEASCSRLFKDYVNNDSEYTMANPEEEGLRTLIASAQHSVFISQQDLIAPCVGPLANSYYDARLFDVLAAKLIEGVKVQIVVSSPGAKQSLLAPYSNMKKMTEITDVLQRKIAELADVSAAEAQQTMCDSLQLAPIRNADGVATWSNGYAIGNHAKTIAVDNAAFYIGSKNLYPATLQDFGYIVEDAAAAEQYQYYYQQPMWQNSKSAATVDYQTGRCL